MSTIRLVSFAAALVATLAWASTGLAFEDAQPKDEALEGLTEALEKAEKGEPAKPGRGGRAPTPEESGPKAAEPEDKGEVAPKDQALDSLLEKLGETTETPAPDDKPAGEPEPSDEPTPARARQARPRRAEGRGQVARRGAGRAHREAEEEEGPGAGRRGDRPAGPGHQGDARRRAAPRKPDTGEATRKKQAEIVKNLDTIIEQLRSTSSSSKGEVDAHGHAGRPEAGLAAGDDPGSNGGQAPNTMPAKPTGKQALADGKGRVGPPPRGAPPGDGQRLQGGVPDLQVRPDPALLPVRLPEEPRARGVTPMRSWIRVHGGPAVRLALLGTVAVIGLSGDRGRPGPAEGEGRGGLRRAPSSATSPRGPPR